MKTQKKNSKKNFQGIYMILNTANNKAYIGSSTSVERRKKDHFAKLKYGKHVNPLLQRSYDKYGRASFTFSLLEVVKETDQLHIREKLWIDLKDTYNREKGFNIGIPGEIYCKPTKEETKHKLRLIALKRHYGDLPEEELLQAQEDNVVVRMTVEEAAIQSALRTSKPVICICNKTNDVLHKFDSLEQAKRELNASDQNLRRVLNNPLFAHKGLVILHESEYDPTKCYKKVYKTIEYVPKARSSKPINAYDLITGLLHKEYESANEAAEDLHTNKRYIYKTINGERGSHRGLTFEYTT